jgi:hypothetical protein
MLRDIILWLAGVPIFVIILLHLFGVLIDAIGAPFRAPRLFSIQKT